MPVVVSVGKIGCFKKNRDNIAEVGVLPNRLNESPLHYPIEPDFYLRLEGENQMDLKIGCEGFKDEGGGDGFQSLFDYIKKTSKKGTPLKEAIGAEFVTTRRILMKFAQSVYSEKPFKVHALRKNGAIFLCDVTNTEPWDITDGYGYKFEMYMSLNKNGEPHDVNETPSNAECFKSVFRTSLKSGNEEFKVFYAAEMDAQDNNGSSVEFTTTIYGHPKWRDRLSLRRYLQCYLGDVPLIVKGLKSRENVVYKVDKIVVSRIPAMDGITWNPQTSFEKLFEVLKEIKSQLQLDDQALIIRGDGTNIYYEPEDPNKCTFVDPDFLRYFE